MDAITAIRLLLQIGITVEQYRQAVNNSNMSDDDLLVLLQGNQDKIDQLLNINHD